MDPKAKLRAALPNPSKESFVMVVSGRRGSGKTTLLTRLLITAGAFKNKFDKIIVISPTFYLSPQWKSLDTSKWDVHTSYNPEIIRELLAKQSSSPFWRLGQEREKICVILDDMGKTTRKVKASEEDPLETLACNGRHLDISVIFLGQQLVQMCPAMRSNADVTIVYASHNLRDNLALYNETGSGDYKSFRDKVEMITNKRYHFLLIRNRGGRLEYFHNFDPIEL